MDFNHWSQIITFNLVRVFCTERNFDLEKRRIEGDTNRANYELTI
jgi:hypothetical protein